MCNLLDIKPANYYSYEQRQLVNKPDPAREEMLDWVKKIADSSQYSYGSRRMSKALNALGYPVGRDKTKTLMKEANIFVRYRKKYKVTTNSKHKQPIFENVLNRQFKVVSPDSAYV